MKSQQHFQQYTFASSIIMEEVASSSSLSPRPEENVDGHEHHGDIDDDTINSVASLETNLKLADKIMAKEMGLLSIDDRNAIYEEIHGVSTMAIEETPELLQTSLRKFQAALDALDQQSRLAYDFIANLPDNGLPSKRLIYDNSFRLRFLRGALFDPFEAARRMASFFEVVRVLYGLEGLRQFDLSMNFFVGAEQTNEAFRTGYIQLLPFRDRSGRKILVYVLDALEIEEITRIKIFLYITIVAAEDPETQRNGIVIVFWPGCLEMKRELPSSWHRSKISRILNSIPTRIACIHMCLPNRPIFMMISALLSVVMKHGNVITRVKVHNGERMELMYQLMGYGIPVNLLPTTGTGTLKVKVFNQWVRTRKRFDNYHRKGDCSVRLECPGVRDVIFRSAGKSCMFNPGNVAFRGYFEQIHDDHIQAKQTAKRDMVWKIVEKVESKGGRFLIWDKRGWWLPLEDRNEIRNKVAISLRGYNKQRKADANRQSSHSNTDAFVGEERKSKRVCTSSSDSDEPSSCF